MGARADLVRVEDALSPRGGLVRGTRRPAGWTSPGPPPQPPEECAALWPDADEDLCWLAGDWRLLQRRMGHRFSLDDLVTAHYATQFAGIAPKRILDLGCGIGTVLLLMAWRFPDAHVRGIEAQGMSAGLARRSIAWNGVGDRCVVVEGDLRDAEILAAEAPFNLVTGTPPYYPRGTGVESEQAQRGPCRFEFRGGVEDYAAAAARYLAPGAAFVSCSAATQAERVAAGATAAGLFVERQRAVIPRAGKAPLVMLFCMRPLPISLPLPSPHLQFPLPFTGERSPALLGGARGDRGRVSGSEPRPRDIQRLGRGAPATITEPPLVVRDRTGRRTEEFVALRTEMGMPP